ncbi:MAG: SoxR reducing system RseC family protein [Bacteroidales bacterium]|nr:SoxR reducing system RseC family protein [Bacteroidales bacterium]
MERSIENVYHEGLIDHQDQRKLYVKILSQSACNACHAKGMCTTMDMKEKIVEVEKVTTQSFADGTPVLLEMKKSLGHKAVILAYLIPFILVISTLLIVSSFASEGVAGLSALSILLPYFLILNLFRKRWNSTFQFTARPRPADFSMHCNPE